MLRGECAAGFERLVGQHGLPEAGEFAIDGRGESLAGSNSAGVNQCGPRAGFVRVIYLVGRRQKRGRCKHDARAVGHDGNAGGGIEAGPATVEEAAKWGLGISRIRHEVRYFFQGIFAALPAPAGAVGADWAGRTSSRRRRMASWARPEWRALSA